MHARTTVSRRLLQPAALRWQLPGVADLLALLFWLSFALAAFFLRLREPRWGEALGSGARLAASLGVLFLLSGFCRGAPQAGVRTFGQGLRFLALAIGLLAGHHTLGLFAGQLQRSGFELHLLRFDLWLLGAAPSELCARFENPWLTEWLQFWYSTYFYLPFPLAICLLSQGRLRDLQRYLLLLVLACYGVFLGYLLVPSLTPDTLQHSLLEAGRPGIFAWPGELEGVWLAGSFRRLIYAGSCNIWDAFPSGHTTLCLISVLAAWKYERRLLWPIVCVSSQVIVATLYLRYHYLLDLVAALALSLLAFACYEGLHRVLRQAVAEVSGDRGPAPVHGH